MVDLNFPGYEFFVRDHGSQQEIFDAITQEYVVLTPEEWVRQHLVQYLIHEKRTPLGLLRREVPVMLNGMRKRADVVVYDRHTRPLIVAECKAPDVSLRQDAFNQVARYNSQLKAPYVMITNGLTHHFCRIDHVHRTIGYLDTLPSYDVACRHA